MPEFKESIDSVVRKSFFCGAEEAHTHFDEIAVLSMKMSEEEAVRKLQAAYKAHCVKRLSLSQFSSGDAEKLRSIGDEVCQLAKGTLIGNSKGLSEKHWLEWKDPKHRYGAHLVEYSKVFMKTPDAGSDFFSWLDSSNIDLAEMGSDGVSRKELEASQVEYCDEESRKKHAVSESMIVIDGKCRLQLNNAKLQEEPQEKTIFVIGLDEILYVHPKIKGKFHHTSFHAGAPVQVAGKLGLDADRCVVKVEPHSGHYQPGLPELEALVDRWSKLGLDLSTIKWVKPSKWRDAWPFNEEGMYMNLKTIEEHSPRISS